nr:beta-L-arabinofuranosidase domain-containing protein [Nesterenkonia sp. Act20]
MTDDRRAVTPVDPARGTRRGLGLDQISLDAGFWKTRQDANSAGTLRHCIDWMERLGWLANFDRVAAGTMDENRPGWQFSDSEVYKLLEALAWEYGRTRDPEIDAIFESLVDRVAAAEDDDGYLNTCFGHAGRPERYSDLSMGHELYCAGHLLQAVVARLRTKGEDRFVALGRRVADHVLREFGPDARDGVCGHPEIEVALAEFARATGETRYRDQAQLFVERRGHGTLAPIPLLSREYFQDEIPVRDTASWHGHAVRALYLAAGAVDIAVDAGDAELLGALEEQWHRTVARRTYLTGGMGSRHQDEGFGEDWELPPDRAYCETCAGVASLMVSWRLYLATGRPKYVDLMERTLFNVIATSPSPDGTAFFYANPLQQRSESSDVLPDAVNSRAEGGVRAPWFDVSCCPTNLARTLASWQSYSAAVDEANVAVVLQYAAGEYRFKLSSGLLRVQVDTEYPNASEIHLRVQDAPPGGAPLRLRVPSWAIDAQISVNGGPAAPTEPGWCDLEQSVFRGDELRLMLPVEPRLTWPDPRIDAMRGTVAVERGPLVLCIESQDVPDGIPLDAITLDTSASLKSEGDGARGRARVLDVVGPADGTPPFGRAPTGETTSADFDLIFVPYHRWAERGPSTMRVFVPVADHVSLSGEQSSTDDVKGRTDDR